MPLERGVRPIGLVFATSPSDACSFLSQSSVLCRYAGFCDNTGMCDVIAGFRGLSQPLLMTFRALLDQILFFQQLQPAITCTERRLADMAIRADSSSEAGKVASQARSALDTLRVASTGTQLIVKRMSCTLS
eukprot:m.218771 g.218771  ORF g.218771 m.218771 type:complete len:132 (+) comp10157_c1_seq40:413-808(+)